MTDKKQETQYRFACSIIPFAVSPAACAGTYLREVRRKGDKAKGRQRVSSKKQALRNRGTQGRGDKATGRE